MKNSNDLSSQPLVASAYAVVPTREDDFPSTPVALAELNHPAYRNVSPEYAHLPEARYLGWEDDFFDDDDDIVAVFDLDYKSMEHYYASLGWMFLGATLFFPNCFGIALLGLVPCYLNRNVQWNVRAQHVAVTRDGIRFVHDKHKTCWGYACADAGKRSKTVPFEKITDCDIVEPAGKCCLCITNVLYTVNVDTASADPGRHEVSLQGLKHPEAFKKLVWAMKRATMVSATASLPQAMEMAGRGSNNEEVATLLREIRDELRQQKEVLQGNVASTVAPSAPSECKMA